MKTILILLSILSFSFLFGQNTYYEQRKSLFETLPNDSNEIIFLGNSITDGSEWIELFKDLRIKNRGISGDVTEGIIARLNEVTESKPLKIFILIGINDLARDVPASQVLTNYRRIIDMIKASSPKTKIYIQSILPVNPTFPKFKSHTNKNQVVRELNEDLKKIARAFGASYIDLHSSFIDANGNLDKAYTNDGLHLTGAGYQLWKKLVDPFVQE